MVDRNKNLFYIIGNNKKILFKSTDFWWNTALWHKITNDKQLTYKVLEQNNIPTANSFYLSRNDLSDFHQHTIDHLTFPLIIKPLDESHWNGVCMNIMSYQELQGKLKISFEKYESMIIQEQIEWEEIRVIVVDDEVLVAIVRIPAFVIWNGRNTIEELIDIENTSNKFRGEWYNKPLAYIVIDQELKDYIQKQWLHLWTIPKENTRIQLRWNSNIWTGWIPKNITDQLHPQTKELCIEIWKILWLRFSWIDIILKNTSEPLNKKNWILLEVNSTAGIWWHSELAWVNTWKRILEKLFFK